MKTAFEKIAHFNNLIGNLAGAATHQQLCGQVEMIREEFQELDSAVGLFSSFERPQGMEPVSASSVGYSLFVEVRDAIADVLVTTYGLAHRLGIDADADLDAVYASNLSKFVQGDQKAATAAHIEVSQRTGLATTLTKTAPGLWAITSSRDQTGKDGKQYPKGKLLKPSTYREPEFK